MGKRDFGTVRRLASGRWQARYPDATGQRRTAPTTFTTRAEAAAFLAAAQTDALRGTLAPAATPAPVPAPAAGPLFDEFARAWLAQRADLRPRTVELYNGLLARHLLPQLGHRPVAAITTAVVREWYAERLGSGAGRSTVAKSYRLLKSILNTALVDELILRNPCVIRGAGAEKTPERVPPTLEQALALSDAIAPRWRMLVLLAAWSGLRWGELVALQRRSIDVATGRITVTQQLTESGAGFRIGPPKTEAGRRTVHLPPHLLPDLEDHLDRWAGPEPDNWVFCGPFGAPLSRRNFTTHWAKARTAAGCPEVRFHDLRHLSATLAATTGATTRELMARMGHSSPRAALIYQHATQDRDQVVAEALSRLATQRSTAPIQAARPKRRPQADPSDQLTLDLGVAT
jgi:integrase